jgi:hypothetical protein
MKRAALLLALMIATDSDASSTRAGHTYTSLRMLEHSLLVHSVRAGSAPTTQAELLALMRLHPEVFHRRAGHDDWNRPLNYRIPSADPSRAFDLYSSGPNGKDDGGEDDDIVPWENRGYYRTGGSQALVVGLAVLLDGPLLALILVIRFVLRRPARAPNRGVG